MSDDILSQLKKTSMFSGVSDDALSVLAEKAATRKLAKDDVLMRKGEAGDSLFPIHKGWVKIVTVDSKGDELIINRCGPREAIGEIALLDPGPRSAPRVAFEPPQVLQL